MGKKKQNLSLRAGTDLTYRIRRGNNIISRTLTLRDIEYIKPEGDVYLAISLNTSATALGESLEAAYSSLIFKLYNYLRDVMNTPGAEIGPQVSEEKIINESLFAPRIPRDRQKRALEEGINAFIDYHKESSNDSLMISKIEYMLTTSELDDTLLPIDVVVSSTSAVV